MRRSPAGSVYRDMQKPRVRAHVAAVIAVTKLREVVGGGRYPGFEQSTLVRSPAIVGGNGGT